jgi:hypothetical protein
MTRVEPKSRVQTAEPNEEAQSTHSICRREGVLASVEIRVATPQNVETLWPSDISTRRRNHPCGRYDGFGDKGKTWN